MNFLSLYSEDVRNSLNVLDQVLSEFDDNDNEADPFFEDKFIISPEDDDSKLSNQKAVETVQQNNKENIARGVKGEVNHSIDTTVNGDRSKTPDEKFDDPGPPIIDRTKKPKETPPALPKKIGGIRTNRLSSDGIQTQHTIHQNATSKSKNDLSHSSDRKSHQRNKDKTIGDDTGLNNHLSLDCTPTLRNQNNLSANGTIESTHSSENKNGSLRSPQGDTIEDSTVKSNNSRKSQNSLGTDSSGTHDYQEINSDFCAEAIQNNHEAARKKQEEEKERQKRQRYVKQQQHKQKKQLQAQQENGHHNQHHHRGRSRTTADVAKKRSSTTNGGPRESRKISRGRSSGPPEHRERSGGRSSNGQRRSRSNERILDHHHHRQDRELIMREQARENLMLPYSEQQDLRTFTNGVGVHPDPRLLVDPNMIDPAMMHPRFRHHHSRALMDSHQMLDPRLLDPRYDPQEEMVYSMQDAIHFPHLMNYPEQYPQHSIVHNLGTHPSDEYPQGYPMYPYDVPYLQDPSGLTPEEIHHLQARMNSSAAYFSPNYVEYPQGSFPGAMHPHHHYPFEYSLDYPSVDYRLQPELTPHYDGGIDQGIVSPIVMASMAGAEYGGPPSPEEAQRTIERMMTT